MYKLGANCGTSYESVLGKDLHVLNCGVNSRAFGRFRDEPMRILHDMISHNLIRHLFNYIYAKLHSTMATQQPITEAYHPALSSSDPPTTAIVKPTETIEEHPQVDTHESTLSAFPPDLEPGTDHSDVSP